MLFPVDASFGDEGSLWRLESLLAERQVELGWNRD
jgi:hypothetical protein